MTTSRAPDRGIVNRMAVSSSATTGSRLRLWPGLRVTERRDGWLQVGLHPGRRVLLRDTPGVRRLLDQLSGGTTTGHDSDAPDTDLELHALEVLHGAGLLVRAEELAARRQRRTEWPIGLWLPAEWEPKVRGLVEEAGLVLAPQDRAVRVWLVGSEGETPRSAVEDLIRREQPHLLVATVGHRVRLGPFVEPGRSACLYCLDAHGADRDPAQLQITLRHTGRDPLEPAPDPALRDLALAWAVRDLITYIDGAEPSTWAATIEVGVGLRPDRTPLPLHPRCGCNWGQLDLA